LTMDPCQPLYVDCSIEYDLDMTRFPGWDDPFARSQPSLMLHLPDQESCPCYHGYPSPEDELQTILQEYSTSEDELQDMIQELCSDIEASEDGLSSFVDDILGFTDDLLTMSDTVSPADSGYGQSLDLVTSTFTSDEETWEDFLCDSYNVDQMTPSPESSSTQSSNTGSLFLSTHQGSSRFYRKRKMSGETDLRPSAKRPRYYSEDLISNAYSTFTSNSDIDSLEDEMRYELSVCVRD
ncbi:uncharacterized protein, partial [Argopecten irradians]|uniref:uncharacterized protein n=1 Tax=Argopecten irradians TaxID=31199 RepID=UPI00371ECDB3